MPQITGLGHVGLYCSDLGKSFADPTRDPLWFELFRKRPRVVDGFMTVPDAPGLASSYARTRWRSTE